MANDQDPATRPSWLKRVADVLVTIRSILVSVGVILVLVALAGIVVTEVRSRPIILLPLAIPQEAQDAGFTGEVIANRISDEINLLAQQSRNAAYVKRVSNFRDIGLLNVSIPETGITLKSVIEYIRAKTSYNATTLFGELICTDAECSLDKMRVRIRLNSEGSFFEDNSVNINSEKSPYFNVAKKMLAVTDPVTFAYYCYSNNRLSYSKRILNKIDDDDPAKAQALTLSGLISALRGNRKRALELYEAAAKISDSPELFNNIGDIYQYLGDNDKAMESYQRAIDLIRGDRKGDAKSFFSIANLHRLSGEFDDALKAYKRTLALTEQFDSNIFNIVTQTDNAEFSKKLRQAFLDLRPRSRFSIALRGPA